MEYVSDVRNFIEGFTMNDRRNFMANLPDPDYAADRFATELVIFCKVLSPTVNELRRLLVVKLGVVKWRKVSAKFPKEDYQREHDEWEHKLNDKYRTTIMELAEAIRAAFSVRVDIAKIADCCQKKKEAVQNYYERLYEVFNTHSGLREPDDRGNQPGIWEFHLISWFWSGLRPEIVQAVKIKLVGWEYERLATLLTYALHAEERTMEKKERIKAKCEKVLNTHSLKADLNRSPPKRNQQLPTFENRMQDDKKHESAIVKQENVSFTIQMGDVSGPGEPTNFINPWTMDEMRICMDNLPNPEDAVDRFATELVIFCQEFSPTVNELKRLLLMKLGGLKWRKVSEKLPKEDYQRKHSEWEHKLNDTYRTVIMELAEGIRAAFPVRVDIAMIADCCQRENEAVQDYYERLYEVFNKHSGLREPDDRGDQPGIWECHLIPWFWKGLRPEISQAVKTNWVGWEYGRLARLLTYALHFENLETERNKRIEAKHKEVLPKAIRQALAIPKCWVCGALGHMMRECSKCKLCKKDGHWAWDCPKNKKAH